MKKLAVTLSVFSTLSLHAYAQDAVEVEVEVEDVTMNVMEQKRDQRQARGDMRSIVADYMLEQGDITVEELEARRAERIDGNLAPNRRKSFLPLVSLGRHRGQWPAN